MSIVLDDAALPPGLRLYAIGDVHGRLDLAERLLATIVAEIARDRADDWRVVFLGDLVDRGPDSAGVVALLSSLTAADPRYRVLAGNHDEGFLAFLADPEAARLFVHYGGAETAASYGVDADLATERGRLATREALIAAVPEGHRAFLAALPDHARHGDFFLAHAGIRPRVALDRQSHRDLLWIRDEFLDCDEPHPAVIIHGHTPARAVQWRSNRVGIDTLAYASGVLTAFAAEGKRKWLVDTRR